MQHTIELTEDQVGMIVCSALSELIKRELDYRESSAPWNKELVRSAAIVVKNYLTEEEWEEFKNLIGMI